jgi:hypothetical protein
MHSIHNGDHPPPVGKVLRNQRIKITCSPLMEYSKKLSGRDEFLVGCQLELEYLNGAGKLPW